MDWHWTILFVFFAQKFFRVNQKTSQMNNVEYVMLNACAPLFFIIHWMKNTWKMWTLVSVIYRKNVSETNVLYFIQIWHFRNATTTIASTEKAKKDRFWFKWMMGCRHRSKWKISYQTRRKLNKNERKKMKNMKTM